MPCGGMAYGVVQLQASKRRWARSMLMCSRFNTFVIWFAPQGTLASAPAECVGMLWTPLLLSYWQPGMSCCNPLHAGLCETVGVSTIRTINYVQQTANGPRLVYRQQQLGPQVLQARTIFLRYGLSRLEAGRVLAHELMHVCLKDGLVAGRPLPPWMEEGMCELASYLWLETQLKQVCSYLSPNGQL